MLINILLITHIAVLGFWLGAELGINRTYHFVTWSSSMPFTERDRLMDHVLNLDQYVRYALIGQVALGTALGALLGYFPGGNALAFAVAVAAAGWLVLAEITHRRRKTADGPLLARADRTVRYAVIIVLLLIGGSAVADLNSVPNWLGPKLILFAVVIACGLALRFVLMRFYSVWRVIEELSYDAQCEMRLRRIYWVATSILVVLWSCIAGIVVLSVWKPAL